MTPQIHWVRDVEPVRLALLPRPRGGDWLPDEISAWDRATLETIVCLLEPHEVRELELTEERSLCEARGIQLLSFPIPDRGVPASVRDTLTLVETLVSRFRRGRAAGVHCRAGIGRSGLITACVLLKLGVPFQEVFPILSRARRLEVPDTLAQVAWVKALSRELAMPI
ncbi:MAG: protein-tyrosine phosphatase family protein [Gammaproteobacteria bacterium]